jgi:hypothetical protein
VAEHSAQNAKAVSSNLSMTKGFLKSDYLVVVVVVVEAFGRVIGIASCFGTLHIW